MANRRSKGKAKVGENVAKPPQIRIEGGDEDIHSEYYIVTNLEPNGNDRKQEEASVQRQLDGGVCRPCNKIGSRSPIHPKNGGIHMSK